MSVHDATLCALAGDRCTARTLQEVPVAVVRRWTVRLGLAIAAMYVLTLMLR